MLHFVAPLALVRQQVTNPGLPHVERAAQDFTVPLQRLVSRPAFRAAFATCMAQLT
jgi:hypothetical protein